MNKINYKDAYETALMSEKVMYDKIKELEKHIVDLEESYDGLYNSYQELLENKQNILNEELQAEIDSLNESNIWYNNRFKAVARDKAKLRKRIDDAIDLIKFAGCYDEDTKSFCDDIWDELPELLGILEGSDK